MITKTLLNLHIYIGDNKLLQVVTFKWEYINIVNSSNCFLTEFEEMKNSIYCVEATKAGIVL